jgi:hypothetical protein
MCGEHDKIGCNWCELRQSCDKLSCQTRFTVNNGSYDIKKEETKQMKLNMGEMGLEKNEKGEYQTKQGQKVLKADDIGKIGTIIDAQILGAKPIDFGEETKVVLELKAPKISKEIAQGLSLNKTNLMTIANAFGDDTDKWIGQAIELRVESTLFKGQKTSCIRVYPKA